ncbi:MAG: DUF1080 domain-containing protein, partial [Bacteroidales bacterium]|nr:DUF1080 domain-containing protein [Bacteroidales bacterium]
SVQAYLACASFADACVGVVMDSFAKSPYRDNTIVVLWSDHGWHLGEKLHWRKMTLWEEATRNIMYMSVPGLTKANQRCDAPVNLLDIYPTLVDLAGLPAKAELEGDSLRPLLENVQASWERPSITTYGFANHSIRSRDWRYVQYQDSSEELYDHRKDPHEFTNLANDAQLGAIKAEHKKWLPRINAPKGGGSDKAPATSENDEGYVSLYNGKNLDGWIPVVRRGGEELARKVFTPAENGVLHVYRDFPDGYQLNKGKNDTHGLIITKKKYRRYSFKFEYKWGPKRTNNFSKFQYDAGMFYHMTDPKIWPRSIEYQIRYNHLTNHNHTGDIWNLGKTFKWSVGPDGTYLPEAEGGETIKNKKGEHKGRPGAPFHALDNQWNLCEVIVMGDRY